jgi:hypothetical protein
MKDTEFIELLNLYLDHELTPADCARLESEVKTNAARRRVYQQYCRMQQGCKALAADFAAEAPAVSSGKILSFESAAPARSRPLGLLTVGSLAMAAACVAFVLVARGPQPAGDSGAAVAHTPAKAEAAPSANVVAAADTGPQTGGIVHRSSLAGDSIFLTGMSSGAVGAAVSPQLAWIQDVQLTPMPQVISAEQLRFDTQLKALPLGTPHQKGNGSVIERSAFEFRP